ncbi:MAG: P63C domain-containing protein [Pyrinomonadaceae bacterium]
MPRQDKIIEPINAKFKNVANALVKGTTKKQARKALYKGELPIGDVLIECAVLDDQTRILSATSVFDAFGRKRKGMNSRLEIDGTNIPPFLAAQNLKPYIDQDVIEWTKPIEYLDGNRLMTGYNAKLLPKMCQIYLNARRDGALKDSQQNIAASAEILATALLQIGIEALVDEATGFQKDRKHDALRLLLSKYIAEGLQKWLPTFPNSFFSELDRLYDNEPTTSQKRPQYYGHFINKYIYEPIEHGYVKAKLNELNIDENGKRRARFFQWLTEEGRTIVIHQIGRVQMLMEMVPDINQFKHAAIKQRKVSIAPYLFDEMNQIIEIE